MISTLPKGGIPLSREGMAYDHTWANGHWCCSGEEDAPREAAGHTCRQGPGKQIWPYWAGGDGASGTAMYSVPPWSQAQDVRGGQDAGRRWACRAVGGVTTHWVTQIQGARVLLQPLPLWPDRWLVAAGASSGAFWAEMIPWETVWGKKYPAVVSQ